MPSRKTKQLKRILVTVIILIPVIAFLLWPMSSSQFEIKTDAGALKQKQQFLSSPADNDTSQNPNIILITVDDMGMADCSLYGEGDIATPNIDRLGEQGVVFENAYVTSPVCAPSRAAMITGRYQHRYGFEFTMQARYLKNRLEYLGFRYFINSDPWVPKWMPEVPGGKDILEQGLPRSEVTLAEVLKRKGYRTGITGKWHLGWVDERKPNAMGFDEQYGFFHSHSLYVPEGTPGYVDQKIEGDWTDPHIWSGQRNGNHAIHRNGKVIEESGYLTDRITEESISFIQNNRDQPFFLWVSYSAPHTPLQAPEEYVEKYSGIKDPVKRVYRAMIDNLDDNLGRLMGFIDGSGLAENTLIFFISDNGGAEYTLTTDNGRYEGGKNTEFEGGVKVPFIMRWTGTIPAGMRYDPMVSSLDIFPTSTQAAHAGTMPGRAIDGENLVPYVTGSIDNPPHEYLFWKRGNSKVVRSNEWKLLINDHSGDTLLYNLKENKYEGPDLSASRPGAINELISAYRQWSEVHSPPVWPSVIYYFAEKDGKRYYFEQ